MAKENNPCDITKSLLRTATSCKKYRTAQMFDGGNFDEFDESKPCRQNFPYQYFTFILSASTCNINGSVC